MSSLQRLTPWFLGWMLMSAVPTDLSATSPIIVDITDTMRLETLTDDVWLHTSRHQLSNGQWFPANGLVVATDEGLVLVDTPWGEDNTAALLDWLDTHFDAPVIGAIATHFHDDSLGGARLFDERDLPVMATGQTMTLAGDKADWLTSLGSLDRGGATVWQGLEIFFPGGAHSLDNVVVYVPWARVLDGNCATRSPTYPGMGNTADGDIGTWPSSIERVMRRYPDAVYVVPGHGPVGDTTLLEHTIDLFMPGSDED